MERSIKDRNILDKICIKFCNIIDKHCKYIVVSGFVAISSGRARGTEDIDIIIERLSEKDFIKLHKDLVKNKFVCIQSDDAKEIYNEYLKNNTGVRYILKNYLLPEVELKFVKDILDEYQLNNRVKLKLTGLNVWFASVNSNIAFKEELLKSDKDLEDARHLRIVYSDVIDEEEINKIKNLIRRFRL
ncbi:MAG: hypothetical protein AB1571_03780 [Nanoarchaeota archaeon]